MRGEKWGYECSPTPYGRRRIHPGGCGRKFHSLADFTKHMVGDRRRCLSDAELAARGIAFLPPVVTPGATLGEEEV